MSDEGKLRREIRLSSHTHKFGGCLYEMLTQESANQAVDEAWRDIQTKFAEAEKQIHADSDLIATVRESVALNALNNLRSDVAAWLKEAT